MNRAVVLVFTYLSSYACKSRARTLAQHCELLILRQADIVVTNASYAAYARDLTSQDSAQCVNNNNQALELLLTIYTQ